MNEKQNLELSVFILEQRGTFSFSLLLSYLKTF